MTRSIIAALSVAIAACGGDRDEEDGFAAGAIANGEAPALCVAMRGNGESILTHFASLARIVEHYGLVEGLAGGSSGSISTFTYESILKNPAVHTCSGRPCAREAEAARVALALKSLEGYADAAEDSPEVVALRGLAATGDKLRASVAAADVSGAAGDTVEAARRLRVALEAPDLRQIVNPEIFAMLSEPRNLTFNVTEIAASIAQLGAFAVDDNRLFFRTGVLSWPALASLFGRVGDFYAGFGPSDRAGMNAWLDACAEPTRDLPWAEAAKVATPRGGTCGAAFTELLGAYRPKRASAEGTFVSRIDEKVGDPRSPLHALVTTAVLEGDAIEAYERARARYVTGAIPSGDVPFSPSFADVRFGYWGRDTDLAKVRSNPRGFDDLKTKKASSLGDATWRQILAASPAEPGLSRFVALADGRISAGGWSDLAPVLALENIGCGQVIYVTRQGDESFFATKIAKKLGMTEGDWRALYDLTRPSSGYARSVATADAVWCTSWDAFTPDRRAEQTLDAFGAPLETRATFSTATALRTYAKTTPRTGKPGCTPGLGAGATFPP